MKAKLASSEVLDIAGRTIVAYVSKFGNIDLDGDMMMHGCYSKSIKERGKNGTNQLFHLSNHRPYPEFILSKPEFEEDSFGLKMTSTILNTNHGDDILKLYENEVITEHSVMFHGLRGKWETKSLEDGKEYTQFNEVKLYEGSTVVWGANPDTPTIEMKSIYKEAFGNDIEKAFSKLSNLQKSIQKGTYTDEMFGILELQTKMLEEFILEEISNLKSIQIVDEAFEPQKEKEMKQDDLIINFLKELKNDLK